MLDSPGSVANGARPRRGRGLASPGLCTGCSLAGAALAVALHGCADGHNPLSPLERPMSQVITLADVLSRTLQHDSLNHMLPIRPGASSMLRVDTMAWSVRDRLLLARAIGRLANDSSGVRDALRRSDLVIGAPTVRADGILVPARSWNAQRCEEDRWVGSWREVGYIFRRAPEWRFAGIDYADLACRGTCNP